MIILTDMLSAFTSFSGIRLVLEKDGQASILVNGTSVIITIATGAVFIVGLSLITKFGPEARTRAMKSCIVMLGAAFLAIKLDVSSLSNLMALVGPAAKG